MNQWDAGNTSAGSAVGQGNDPHTQVVGSYFTCQPISPNSNDPFSFDPSTKNNAKPVGPSLDHVIAQQLSPGGTPLFMRLGNHSDSPMSGISYSAPLTGYAGHGKVADIFHELTGLFPGGSTNPDTYAVL